MLSPDVPEFVPRKFQNPESSTSGKCLSQDHVTSRTPLEKHSTPSHASYPSSAKSHHNADQVLREDFSGSLGNTAGYSSLWQEASISNNFKSHRSVYKPDFHASKGNWKGTNSDNWKWNRNSLDEGNARFGKKKLPGSSSSYNMNRDEKQNWRERDDQYNTHWKSTQAPFRKRTAMTSSDFAMTQNSARGLENITSTRVLESRIAPQGIQHIEKPIEKEINASGSILGKDAFVGTKQKPAQRKTKSQSVPKIVAPDASKINQKAKVERTELPFQVKHDLGNVSYRKILSRKDNDASLQSKTESSADLISSHSEEQWPSLSVSHLGTPVGKSCSGNVWVIDSNTEPSAVWPRVFPTREATSSFHTREATSSQNSPGSDLLDRKNNKNIENRNIRMDKKKQILQNPTDKRFPQTGDSQTKDFLKKKGKAKQGNFQRSNNDCSSSKEERELDNRKRATAFCKSQAEGTVGDITEKENVIHECKSNSSAGRDPQNHKNSGKMEMTQRRYPVLSANKKITSEENSKPEGTDACASLTENEESQWQVMKKKKSKVKEQKGKGEEKSQNSNCEYGSGKSEYQKNASRAQKQRDTGTERRGSGLKPTHSKMPDNKDYKGKGAVISSKTDKYKQRKYFKDNGDSDSKRTFAEEQTRNDSSYLTPVHKIEASLPKRQLSTKGGRRKGGGIDGSWRDPDARYSKTSKLVSAPGGKDKSVSGSEKDLQKISMSSAERKKSAAEIEAIQKAKVENKAKIREEKMRKKEAKLKKAKAQMVCDSKVTLVNKELLEMMYGGKNQQSKENASSKAKFEMKDQYKQPSHVGDNEMFQLSSEDYPSLTRGRSKVSTKTKNNRKPSLCRDDRSYYESWSDEEYYDYANSDEENYEHTNEEPQGTTLQEMASDFEVSCSQSKSPVVTKNASKYDSLEDGENQSERISAIDNPESRNDVSQVHTEDALPSYSRALLTSAKIKVVSEKPQVKVTVPKVAAPKKKVKTKDEMTFDIMEAVIKKVKKSKNNVPHGHGQNPLLWDSGKAGTRAGQKAEKELLAKKSSKMKKSSTKSAEVVVKRGRQQEVPKKKKLSRMKKAIKKSKQIEIENLLFVLEEAKKIQGNTKLEDASLEPRSVPSMPLADLICTVTSKSADADKMDMEKNLPRKARFGGDNIVLSTPTLEDNRDVDIKKDREFLDDSHKESSSCIPLRDVEKENQELQNNLNLKKNQEIQNNVNLNNENNLLDPEFSQKCAMAVDDLKCINDSVHSKKFREYCNHVITPEVNTATGELIHALVGFQERHYKRDPVKARIRQRYICGLRGASKAMGKLSCVVIAPDILRCKGPGALDELVEKVLSLAEKQGVPVIFALSRRKLARLCIKKTTVSCVGIISYHGAQDIFHKLMDLIPEAKKQYQDLVARGRRTLPVGDEPPDEEFVPGSDSIGEVSGSSTGEEVVPGSDSISEISVVSKDALSAVPNEERSADVSSMPSSLNTREEIIASMVAILSDK